MSSLSTHKGFVSFEQLDNGCVDDMLFNALPSVSARAVAEYCNDVIMTSLAYKNNLAKNINLFNRNAC